MPSPCTLSCQLLIPLSLSVPKGKDKGKLQRQGVFNDLLFNNDSSVPGIVLSRRNPKNPPMNMCVVKSTTITWSSSCIPSEELKRVNTVKRSGDQVVYMSKDLFLFIFLKQKQYYKKVSVQIFYFYNNQNGRGGV